MDDITFSEALSVFISFMIDDFVSAEVPRIRARSHVLDVIEEQARIYLMLEFQSKNRRVSWGTTVSSEVGMQNAQAIVGGPAGPPPSA